MESAAQKCARLVVALEQLVAVEAVLLVERDHEKLSELQERTSPIVAQLTELAPLASTETRDRILAVVARRVQHDVCFSEHTTRLEAELRDCREARSRLTNFAPAYRPVMSSSPRLRAHG
jgi:hypothetical protein